MKIKKLLFTGLLLGSFLTLGPSVNALDYIEGPIATDRVEASAKKEGELELESIKSQEERLAKLNMLNPLEVASFSAFNASKFGIVAPVKDQGYKHTCWAHTIAGVAETAILKDGLSPLNVPISVSPDNIAFTTTNRIASNDILANTSSDIYSDSWNKGYHIGYGIERLSQWNGVYLRNDDNSYGEEGFFKPEYLLKESIEIDNTDINSIKRAIAEYGSVTMYYDYDPYQQDDFFKPEGAYEAHAVQIIGWDDNISPSMFRGNPTTPGGWLCKNSWGSNPRNDGLFYLSYEGNIYDTYAMSFLKYDPSLRNYYYDGMLKDNSSAVARAAVIFEAKGEDEGHNEQLEAINVKLKGKNIRARVEVYLNPVVSPGNRMDPRNNPTSGTLVASVAKEFWTGGDRRIELPRPVELKRGDYYSIVVEVEGDNSGIVMSNEPFSYNDLSFYYDDNSFKPSYLNSCGVARINGITRLVEKPQISATNDLKYANISLNRDYLALQEPGYEINARVSYEGKELIEGLDYKIAHNLEYISPISNGNGVNNVGYGEIKIMGLNDYKGSLTSYYPIIAEDYADVKAVGFVDGWGKVYLEAKGDIKTLGEIELPYGYKWVSPNASFEYYTDIPDAIYYDGPNKEIYRNLYRTVQIEEYRRDAISIASLEVSGLRDKYSYTGSRIAPTLEFSLAGDALVEGKDLKLEYINNYDAGMAKIIIRGIGKYQGRVELGFEIIPADNLITDIKMLENEPKAEALFGNVEYIYYSDNGKTRISRVEALASSSYYIKAIVNEGLSYHGAVGKILKVENNKPTDNIMETEASLKIRYNRDSRLATKVDIRFGSVLKEIDPRATYGVLILDTSLKASYTKQELDSLRKEGKALDIKPVWDGDMYRFAWVVTNMDDRLDKTLYAVVYKELDGAISLGKPKAFSISSLSSYYLANGLATSQEVEEVLINLKNNKMDK